MIDSILLQNFQAHEESVLELDKGVNVIVGESDAGKSAILRSIYWTVFGRPSGESIIRQGAKEPCRVKIKTADGHEVVRVRGCGQNKYEVDGEVYKAFNKSVPEDVTRTLNMDRLNFSLQLDPPFLFSMSGGDVAQYMNKLVDLEVITTSLSRVNQMVRKSDDNARSLEASIEEKEAAVAKMAWVDEAKKAVQKLEAKDKKSFKLKKHLAVLEIAYGNYETALEQAGRLSHVDNAEKALSRMQAKAKARKKAADACSWLEDALESIGDAQRMAQAVAWADSADKAILRIRKKQEVLLKKKHALDSLSRSLQKYAECLDEVERTTGVWNKNRLLYKREFPSVCPLCGQNVNKENL